MGNMNLDRHQIYMGILNKYKNNVFPQIPLLLLPYVLNNRDKVDMYLSKNINIHKILRHLNKLTKEKEEFKILDEIIKFVEEK